MLSARKKREAIVAVIATFLMLVFVASQFVVPLINRKSAGLAPPRKEPQKKTGQQIVSRHPQATNVPLRKPPENVQKRALPPTITAHTSTQDVVKIPPQANKKLNQQWTKPLAMPAKNPEPPNPLQPPPLKVDPERHPAPDVPRRSID